MRRSNFKKKPKKKDHFSGDERSSWASYHMLPNFKLVKVFQYHTFIYYILLNCLLLEIISKEEKNETGSTIVN